jgi:neutral trehalase
MPDRKPVDLDQTATEKETGMVDPYAAAQRAAMAGGFTTKASDRTKAIEASLPLTDEEIGADYGEPS